MKVHRVIWKAAALGLLWLFVSCGESVNTIKRMQKMEEGVDNPTTIEEYRDAIKKYEKRAADIELANEQVGIWYKILGSRYLDKKMYGEAFKCYQKAIEFFPQNQNLYYWLGVCAGYMSKSSLDYEATADTTKKYNYLKLAESAYLEAIRIEPRYVRALYGLSVLYVFELDESDEAIPYLETLLTIDKGHTDAKFVLANAYYRRGDMQKAIDLYDDIEKTSKSNEARAAAAENKQHALDLSYGQ